MQKSVYIYTYGCQMNVHDSEKMLGILSENGYAQAESPDDADLIIFNTCAIREKAEQKFYSQLGRTKALKRRRQDLKIGVAGCVAQESKGKVMARAPHVDFILGPGNIHGLGKLLDHGMTGESLEDDPYLAYREFRTQRESSLKAWVSIMYGCNNFCSYCIVPYTRGREVSRPAGSIVAEAGELSDKGYKEVTLLGQNVNSYRSDMDFPDLLQQIDRLKIDRVRFVTSHPRDFSSRLVEAIAELESVCEHVHLPLQSGSDRVLAGMNRKYTYEQYLEKVCMLRDRVPGVAITTDIIAGFPGETDEDHAATVKALEEVAFDGIFAFKFSNRDGTVACGMKGQLPEEVKSERLKELLKIQEKITFAKNRTLEATEQEILVEGPSETDASVVMGRTRTNKIVTVSAACSPGEIIKVRIKRARLHSLEAVLPDI